MKRTVEGDCPNEFWRSERAERWARQQSFEQLIRTYDRLQAHTNTRIRAGRGGSAHRIGMEVIRSELLRRREERDRQDKQHSPLGEDPQHLRDLDGCTPTSDSYCDNLSSKPQLQSDAEVRLEEMR